MSTVVNPAQIVQQSYLDQPFRETAPGADPTQRQASLIAPGGPISLRAADAATPGISHNDRDPLGVFTPKQKLLLSTGLGKNLETAVLVHQTAVQVLQKMPDKQLPAKTNIQLSEDTDPFPVLLTHDRQVVIIMNPEGSGLDGSFKTFRIGYDLGNNKQLAVLQLKNQGDTEGIAWRKQLFDKEVRILAALDHPNIPKVLYNLKNATNRVYMTECYPDGDLFQCLKELGDAGERFPLGDVATFAESFISALSHVHERGYVHRDIKLENLLVNVNEKKLALIDFGLAAHQNDAITDVEGSASFASPEVLTGFIDRRIAASSIDWKQADLCAAGLVLTEFFLGSIEPYYNGVSIVKDRWTDIETKKRMIVAGFKTLVDKLEGLISARYPAATQPTKEALHSLLSGLLQLDPAKRDSASVAMEKLARLQETLR